MRHLTLRSFRPLPLITVSVEDEWRKMANIDGEVATLWVKCVTYRFYFVGVTGPVVRRS